MKSTLVITTAVATAFLSGCSAKKAEQNAQICADVNGKHVDDYYCENRGTARAVGFYSWYYITRGGKVPAMGEKMAGGSFTPTKGVQYAKSGSTERGGFGQTGKTMVVVHS